MAYRIEGYAIISEDGMLANAEGVIPPELVIEADQKFFMRGLDAAAAVVHGRNSFEQPQAPGRRRLVATRQIPTLARDPDNTNALQWNPSVISFEQAMRRLGIDNGAIAIIGGTDIFGLFLPRYDVFHLTRAAKVRLRGGRPVFPQVPERSPEEILSEAGLQPGPVRMLDPARAVSVVTWRRDRIAV